MIHPKCCTWCSVPYKECRPEETMTAKMMGKCLGFRTTMSSEPKSDVYHRFKLKVNEDAKST